MKTAIKALISLAVIVPAAGAAQGSTSGGMSLLAIIFLAFGAAILLLQFVPAMALFGSMIYGLFAAARRRTAPASGDETHEHA